MSGNSFNFVLEIFVSKDTYSFDNIGEGQFFSQHGEVYRKLLTSELNLLSITEVNAITVKGGRLVKFEKEDMVRNATYTVKRI